MPGINATQIVLQAFGGVLTSLFILDGWSIAAYWWVVVGFSLIPAFIEVGILVGGLGCNLIRY